MNTFHKSLLLALLMGGATTIGLYITKPSTSLASFTCEATNSAQKDKRSYAGTATGFLQTKTGKIPLTHAYAIEIDQMWERANFKEGGEPQKYVMLLFTDRELPYDLVNGYYPSAWLAQQRSGGLNGVQVILREEYETTTFLIPRSQNRPSSIRKPRTTEIKIEKDWVSGEANQGLEFLNPTDNEYKVLFKAPLQHLIDKVLEGQAGFSSSPVQAIIADDPVKQGNWDAIRRQLDTKATRSLETLLADIGSEKVLTSLRTLLSLPELFTNKEASQAYIEGVEALQKDLGKDKIGMLLLVGYSIYSGVDKETLSKELIRVMFSGNKARIFWGLRKDGATTSWYARTLKCENGFWKGVRE